MKTLTKALIILTGSLAMAGCVIDDTDYVATSSSTTYYRPANTYRTTTKTYYNTPAQQPASVNVFVKEKHRHNKSAQPAPTGYTPGGMGYQAPAAPAAPAGSQGGMGYQAPAAPAEEAGSQGGMGYQAPSDGGSAAGIGYQAPADAPASGQATVISSN